MKAARLLTSTNPEPEKFPAERVAWVSFEGAAAYRLLEQMLTEIKRVTDKQSIGRIHDARVTLRRWFAIWHTMRQDGWESKKFRNNAIVPLEHLLAQLGEVRDMDVLSELAADLNCKDSFLEKMKVYREEARKDLVKSLRIIDVNELIKYIGRYLRKRRNKMELGVRQSNLAQESVSEHMHAILAEHEAHVRKLEENSADPKTMHHLRLGIKGWRYLLSEFFLVKDAQLEFAQGLLGDIHDLDELSEWLLTDGSNIVAISNLKQRRAALLEDVPAALGNLPYGLRPSVEQTSIVRR
ncbi:MAG TPA: CHAD domain-containing protein [Oculatellaceae cyanobacterium]